MEKIKSKAPNRKGKKNWKKNIDITGLEDELDEIRKEEVIFGGKVEEQANDDLYAIDVEGDAESKRKIKSQKTLKIDEILKPQSKVPAVGSAHSKAQKNVSRYLLSKFAKEQVKKLQKKRKPESIVNKKENKKRKAIIARDIWEEEETVPIDESLIEIKDIVYKPKPKAPKTLKMKPVLAEKLPAVKIEHPGTSYNPTFNDHQDALKIAVEVEEKKVKEKELLEKKLSYPPELDEMSDHEVIDDDDEEEEEEEVEENTSENNVKKNEIKRKTKTQRNKEKRQKKMEEERLKKLQQKQLIKQIESIEEIKSTIENTEKEIIEKMNKPKKEGIPRLSKAKFEPKSMDIQLTEELSESLRGLKPEGNLFTDRFKSFQERTIIEPRNRSNQ